MRKWSLFDLVPKQNVKVFRKKKSGHSSKKNLAKNWNTFFGVCPNTRISSYVENIFTETPNEKFDVSVNIFSTYEEMEPIRFGSRTSKFLEKKNRDIVPKKNLAENLNTFFWSLDKPPDFLICREYIYRNTKREIRCFRKYILYI